MRHIFKFIFSNYIKLLFCDPRAALYRLFFILIDSRIISLTKTPESSYLCRAYGLYFASPEIKEENLPEIFGNKSRSAQGVLRVFDGFPAAKRDSVYRFVDVGHFVMKVQPRFFWGADFVNIRNDACSEVKLDLHDVSRVTKCRIGPSQNGTFRIRRNENELEQTR